MLIEVECCVDTPSISNGNNSVQSWTKTRYIDCTLGYAKKGISLNLISTKYPCWWDGRAIGLPFTNHLGVRKSSLETLKHLPWENIWQGRSMYENEIGLNPKGKSITNHLGVSAIWEHSEKQDSLSWIGISRKLENRRKLDSGKENTFLNDSCLFFAYIFYLMAQLVVPLVIFSWLTQVWSFIFSKNYGDQFFCSPSHLSLIFY